MTIWKIEALHEISTTNDYNCVKTVCVDGDWKEIQTLLTISLRWWDYLKATVTIMGESFAFYNVFECFFQNVLRYFYSK